MGSLGYSFEQQHCCFPPSLEKSEKNADFEVFSVTKRLSSIHDDHANIKLLPEQISSAWALMLHAYVRNDNVCFFFPSLSSSEVNGHRNNGGGALSNNVPIAHYHIRSKLSVVQARLLGVEHTAVLSLSERQINTAVLVADHKAHNRLFGRVCSRDATDLVSFYNVGTEVRSVFLLFKSRFGIA